MNHRGVLRVFLYGMTSALKARDLYVLSSKIVSMMRLFLWVPLRTYLEV